jgi:predicted dehydrogenase
MMFAPHGLKDHILSDEPRAMPRGGQHITVPTIVGETYEQRSAVERAMQDLRHQRLIDADLLRRINDMGFNPVSGRLRRRLKDVRAQLGSPAALTEYYILAMKIVATREQAAALMRDKAAEARDGSESDVPLTSIDNETGYAAQAAGRLFLQSHGKLQGYFTAIHRTTDYVRRTRDAAAITMDDLASERGHAGERTQMIATITRVLYKLFRRFLRFRLPVPAGMTVPAAVEAAYQALDALGVIQAGTAAAAAAPLPPSAPADGAAAAAGAALASAAGGAAADTVDAGGGADADPRALFMSILAAAVADAPPIARLPGSRRIPSPSAGVPRTMWGAAAPTSPLARTSKPGPLRWGIIGAGNIARKFAEGVAAPGSRSALVAVAKRNLAECARYVAELTRSAAPAAATPGIVVGGVTCYGSYDAVLVDPSVDAVYIALPNHLHVEWALRALAAGKHALIEKPIAPTATEVDAIAAAAAAANRHAAEAMVPMYHPQRAAIRAACAAVGPIRRVCAHYHHELDRSKAGIAFNRAEGGGALLALGCYPVAVAQALVGPLTVAGVEVVLDTAAGVEPANAVDATFRGSLTAPAPTTTAATAAVAAATTTARSPPVKVTFSCSITEGKTYGLVVFGEKGRVMVASPFRPGRDGPLPPTVATWMYPSGVDLATAEGEWPTAVGGAAAFGAGDRGSFIFGKRASDGAPTIAGIAEGDAAATAAGWTWEHVEPIDAFAAEVRAFEAVVLDNAAPQYSLRDAAAAVATASQLAVSACWA